MSADRALCITLAIDQGDARCALSPLHRSSSSAWLSSVQRADPDVLEGRYARYDR